PSPITTSVPRPARAAGAVSARLTDEPTPTVWSRDPSGRSRVRAATISLSKPIKPSVINTTCRWASFRSGRSASTTAPRISVPPPAVSGARAAAPPRVGGGADPPDRLEPDRLGSARRLPPPAPRLIGERDQLEMIRVHPALDQPTRHRPRLLQWLARHRPAGVDQNDEITRRTGRPALRARRGDGQEAIGGAGVARIARGTSRIECEARRGSRRRPADDDVAIGRSARPGLQSRRACCTFKVMRRG